MNHLSFRTFWHKALGSLLPLFLLLGSVAYAQVTTASVDGTVADNTGAVIPGAKVALSNVASGDTRKSTSNGSGIFTFASVPTGTYNVTITANGFQTLQQTNVHLDPEDKRSLGVIKLTIGETSTVTVEADNTSIPPMQAEVSSLITAQDIARLSVEGRDVTELEKILPGFAIAQSSGSVANTAYDPSEVSITGALGQYSANGSPTNGVALLSDGANLTDPGNYGSAVQNVNYDMTEEVKVQTSNFGADIANGPVVINAVGKSGGDHFHGSLYVYGRTNQLNSQDPLTSGPGLGKPADREIYPGGTISGPFRIPGTKINRSNRVTFFIGGEDYAQRNVFAYGSASQAVYNALVPTAAMRAGDFSAGSLQQYLGTSYNCQTATACTGNYTNIAPQPTIGANGTPLSNGNISAFLDPGSQAILNSLPLPNEPNTTGYNFHGEDLVDNDLWQVRGRTDIALTPNNHIFGVYNVEHGRDARPQSLYYAPGGGSGVDMGGVNTPGGILEQINSETASFDLTSTFGASRTNEVFADLTYLNDTFGSSNVAAQEANYPYHGIYANGTKALPQVGDYGYDGLPLELTPDFTIGRGIYAHKFTPSVGDNYTEVIRNHTIKIGTFVQRVENNQVQPNLPLPSGSCTACTNGFFSLYYFPAAGTTFTNPDMSTFTTSGNWLANFEEGAVQTFQGVNFTPAQDLYFWNIDGYATDTWKITKRLQLELGVRFEHLGEWQDAHGIGAAIFDSSQYTNMSLAEPGLQWHAINSNIPNSGAPGRAVFFEPRGGFSFNASGDGKTIIRGGFGMYRAHDNWNDVSNAFASAQGVQSSEVGGGPDITLKAVSNSYNLPANASAGSTLSSISALSSTDNQEPLTETYSFTVSQQLPKNALLQISYVGNNSDFLINDASSGSNVENINALPIGSLYKPNPITGVVTPVSALAGISVAAENQYRPYPLYTAINIPRHVLAANYNGLQTTLEKRTGKAIFGINYTWSKSLAYHGGYYNGPAIDPTNYRSNYGIASYDRTNVFNSSYSYAFGNVFHQHLAAAFGNGWQLSGITIIQSGPDLQSINSSADFGLTVHGANGTTYNNVVGLGTPDVVLQPTLTCNPGVKPNGATFINENCFGLAPLGQNGVSQFPYLHGPAYLDTDLTATKDIHLRESQTLQLRFEAFNFVNHPLNTFTGASGDQTLTFNSTQANPALIPSNLTPAPGFGVVARETGRRVLEAAVKYYF